MPFVVRPIPAGEVRDMMKVALSDVKSDLEEVRSFERRGGCTPYCVLPKKWTVKFWIYVLNGDIENAEKYHLKIKTREAADLDELMFPEVGPSRGTSTRARSLRVTASNFVLVEGESEQIRLIAEQMKKDHEMRTRTLEVLPLLIRGVN